MDLSKAATRFGDAEDLRMRESGMPVSRKPEMAYHSAWKPTKFCIYSFTGVGKGRQNRPTRSIVLHHIGHALRGRIDIARSLPMLLPMGEGRLAVIVPLILSPL